MKMGLEVVEMWEWPEVQVVEMHQWKSGSAFTIERVRKVSYLVCISYQIWRGMGVSLTFRIDVMRHELLRLRVGGQMGIRYR